jgi:hypothetical protein
MSIYKMSKKDEEDALERMKSRLIKERVERQRREEEALIRHIKDEISALPPHQEEACNELAEYMRRIIREAGSPVGELALALVGAETQIAPD